MKELWREFENWLAASWPDGLADLNPPASDADIAKLERTLGVRLPPDYIECLKIHNGQAGRAGGLIDNCEFLSCDAVCEQWRIWKRLHDDGQFDGIACEPDKGIKDDWWNPKWIPLTHNGGGDHDCLDLDPAPAGSYGQVITMWHHAGNREVQGDSFRAWFRRYVRAVLTGNYVYSVEFGGLTDVDYA
jgi:cell wall assembly regulator SMI1